MNNQEICRRVEQLSAERKTIEATWRQIERFITPYRGEFFTNQTSEHQQDWRKREVFDSTAINALQTLAASLQGSITSAAYRWFSLAYAEDTLNSQQEVREWLDDTTTKVYNSIQDSNFNVEIGEAYTDLCGYGSSVVLQEYEGGELGSDEKVKIVFSTVPTKEAYFDEDHKQGVYAFYRRLLWTPSQIISKFGEENVPEKINGMYAKGDVNRMEVLFAIYKRKDHQEVEGIVSPDKRPYGFKYVLKEGAITLGEEGGYYEMPVYIPRWRKTSESKWGNSPAMNALSDVLTLNQLVELTLRAAEKAIDPPLKATARGVISDVDLNPAGITIVRDTQQELIPFANQGRFDVSQLVKGDLQNSIEKAFLTDQLQLKNSPAMTATETMARMELMQRVLGPTLGRLQTDLLSPLITRTLNILFRAGKLLPLPDALVQSTDTEVNIAYIGSLARSQSLEVVANVERYLGILGGIANFKPEVLDLFDGDAAARDIGSDLNIPAKYLHSEDDVQAIRMQRQEQAQAAMAAEQARAQGEALNSMGKGVQAMGEVTNEQAQSLQ